jgi:hypothetical protein
VGLARLTSVPRYRVTVLLRSRSEADQQQPVEVAMFQVSAPMHSPAPAPDGPIACTLHPNEYAGRLEDFRRGVFTHLVGMERPEPTRLRLILAGDTDPEEVRELLIREQGCCAFMSFTITPRQGKLEADLEVPAEAGPALDGLVALSELAVPQVAP